MKAIRKDYAGRSVFAVRRGLMAGLAAGLVLAGCGRNDVPFNATDVSGVTDWARGFELADASGRKRTLAEFKGQVVALFFGYTQCPDVCPTTMTTMAEVMKLLGKDADRLQVVFVTLDPERDTAALLADYVPQFDKRFIGLRGDEAATAAVAKEFKVFYSRQQSPSGGYTLDHSSGIYVLDPQGRLRLYVKHGEVPARVAADLKQLLAGK